MTTSSCKVDAAISSYSLKPPGGRTASMDDYLVARWTGHGRFQEVGYKHLTRWFNEHILTTVYESNGRSTVGSRISGDYEILRGDDDILRDELVADLAADGIDGEAVIDDMVSWSTMRRHLNGCLSVEKETTSARTDWEADSVAIARETLEGKLEEASRSLGSKGSIAGGDQVDVHVETYLGCPECNVRVPFAVARERGYVCEAHLGESAPSRDHKNASTTGETRSVGDVGGR